MALTQQPDQPYMQRKSQSITSCTMSKMHEQLLHADLIQTAGTSVWLTCRQSLMR